VADKFTVQAAIEILLKGKGGEDSVKLLRQLEAESKKTRKSLGDLGKGGEQAATGLVGSMRKIVAVANTVKTALLGAFGIFAGGAVVRLFSGAFTEFARTERAFGSIVAQAKALGTGAEVSAGQVRKFIKELSEQSGILDDDLIPAMNKALLLFEDFGSAQQALSIAARFAANGLGDVQGNVEGFGLAMQGNERALKRFGIEIKVNADGTKDLSGAFEELAKKAAALPSSLNDAQARIDRMAIAWDNAKDAASGSINRMLERLDALGKKLPLLKLLAVGSDPTGLNEALLGKSDRFGSVQGGGSTTADPLARAAKEKEEEAAKAKAKEKAERDQKQADADAKALAERLKREKDATLDAKADEYVARLEQRRTFEDQLLDLIKEKRDEQTALEAAAIKEADDALLDLEIELAEARAEALREVDAEAFALADEQLQALLEQRLKRQLAQELEGLTEGSAAYLKVKEKFKAKEDALEARHAQVRVDVTQAEVDAKVMLQLQSIQMIAGALGTLFAKNKTVAIAAAIVDTIAASVAALKNGGGVPWGIPPMLATLAMGYARVSQIRSTNEGSAGADATRSGGFDVPAHDRMAETGGFRWSQDMVNKFTAGASRGVSPNVFAGITRGWERGMMGTGPAAPGQVSNNYSNDYADRSTTSLDLRGAYMDRRGLRKLARKMRREGNRDGRARRLR